MGEGAPRPPRLCNFSGSQEAPLSRQRLGEVGECLHQAGSQPPRATHPPTHHRPQAPGPRMPKSRAPERVRDTEGATWARGEAEPGSLPN